VRAYLVMARFRVPVSVLAFLETAVEEAAVGLSRGEVVRLAVGVRGLGPAAQPAEEVGAGGGQEMV
jgi:hypothetical protein